MRLSCSLLVLCLCADAATATLPLAFEARGANYVWRGSGYALTIAADGARMGFLHMRLAAANPQARPQGEDRMPGRVTYLLGSAKGPTFDLYGAVRVPGVYRGIDLLYHGNRQHLEYDFEIAPHASVTSIALTFEGAGSVEIDSAGDLVLHAEARTIRQPKPQAWQTIAGVRRLVSVEYRKLAGGKIGFRVAAHHSALPLTIDPTVVFDNLFGGSGGSAATGVALDAQGNIYAAGNTTSVNFNTVNPAQGQLGTAPVLSSTDGGKTWTAVTIGSAIDITTVVAAPGSPSTLYATTEQGVFRSTDGGATWNLRNGVVTFTDISVDAGSPSTVYGCSSAGVFVSTDGANSWTLSESGIALLTNLTSPVQCYAIRANPAQPGVVFDMANTPAGFYRSVDSGQTWTMLDPGRTETVNSMAFVPGSPSAFYVGQLQGAPLQSLDDGDTWLPFPTAQVAEDNHALLLDPNNSATLYVLNSAGVHKSSDNGATWTTVLANPTPSTVYNGFLAADSSRIYASTASGLFISSDSGQTWTAAKLPYAVTPNSLYVAPDGSRILLGTQSAGDTFVTKWDPTGTQVLYSTYLGGSGSDSATGIAVDAAGSAYLLGNTSSANFPVTANALQTSLVGNHNAFLAKLSPDGSQLVYSTYFGGGSEYPAALALDSSGAAYFTGWATSGLPVSANAFQPKLGDNTCPDVNDISTTGDAFVAKISQDGSSLAYASYLGGSCGDQGLGITVAPDGSAWVVGATFSSNFPVTSTAIQPQYAGGSGDGFIAKISPTGTLAYSTYLGGTDYDQINAITLDADGNLYLTGSSYGLSQPVSPGTFQPAAHGGCPYLFLGPEVFNPDGNAFVLIMNPTATAVTGLTYIGSPCNAGGTAIALDPTGGIWIAGSPSNLFPTIDPFQIQTGNGFISKFSNDLTTLLFSTYFDGIGGLAVNASGKAIVAGATPVPAQAYVAEIDSTPSPISLDNVATVSPYQLTTFGNVEQIVAGKVLLVTGSGMGPATPTAGIVSGGVLATSVAGVQVTFSGIPAPLLWVSATQIECIVPFELVPLSMTTIQVTYNRTQSNTVIAPVFTAGTEVLAVLNQDFTVNSPSNPGLAGSTMTLYVTGTGQTNPSSTDGEIYRNPLPLPNGAVTVKNSSTPLPVTFAAAADGLAAGILQVNFQAPAQTPEGVLILTVNGSLAYFTLTVH